MSNKRGIAKCMGATPTEHSTRISMKIMDTFVRSIASFDVPAWAQDVIGDTGWKAPTQTV